MAKKSPVTYAEQELGVHKVWYEALNIEERLADLQAEIAGLSGSIRTQQEKYDTAEANFIMEKRAEMADKSHSAFEREVKALIATNQDLSEHRKVIHDLTSNREQKEAEANSCKNRLRLAEARMKELGGLLHFYAATKSAQVQVQHTYTPVGHTPGEADERESP